MKKESHVGFRQGKVQGRGIARRILRIQNKERRYLDGGVLDVTWLMSMRKVTRRLALISGQRKALGDAPHLA